jgi:aryl-alcohol dehydrogenase-like predicted oxidoreductase
MEYTTLGRTGLRVSRMGLGCGGHSRLGISRGKTEAEAENIVRESLALGINFIDTAEGYRTEEIVGRGVAGTSRDQIVLSTKAGVNWQERKATRAEMRERVEACLQRLRTDYVDIFHLHGVSANDYPYAREEIFPEIQKLQAEGKIRFTGITEVFASDPSHRMLALALPDDCWDVIMVGFNLLNQSARESVLTQTQKQNVGTLCMFAVRRALSQPDALRELISNLVSQNLVDRDALDSENPLDFLTAEGVASNIPEAAYRFCRWEPGLDVILSGTGSIEHLRENAVSLSLPPLPSDVSERLRQVFARVDSVSGN